MCYSKKEIRQFNKWKKRMNKKPSIIDKASKGTQNKINEVLPDKYHEVMTSVIKNMTKAVLLGSKYVTIKPYEDISMRDRDYLLEEKTKVYRTTAVVEGAATGAGGIFVGLADFPLLLSIKIKFLYDVAAIYGYDTNDYKERVFILNVFQLAFSSQNHVNQIFKYIENWDIYKKTLPDDINDFDWRTFQQEYRDYLDLAKLMQLVPVIGSVVGAYVNHRLLNKLSETAMYAYRMRYENRFQGEIVDKL